MNPSDHANLPVKAPPPGIMSNFDHPQTRATEAHVAMGICIGLTFLFIVLRMYVKLVLTHMWGWDDCACILGWALIFGHNVIVFTSMRPGKVFGTHVWDIRVTNFTKSYFQGAFATINLYAASAFFVKLSLFLLYFRLFKPNKIARWFVCGGIVVCGLFYSASIIINCALCVPPSDQPDDTTTWLTQRAKCDAPTERLAVVQSVFSTISDIYLLMIPIGSVFQLQLPTNRKLGVSAIFTIGFVAIACSLGNLSYRTKLIHAKDSTWLSARACIFSAAEVSAGIICSCSPIFASLFRNHAHTNSRFPSPWFLSSRLFSRKSQRALISDQNPSSDKPYSNRHADSGKHESSDYVELESGSSLVKPENAVLVSRFT